MLIEARLRHERGWSNVCILDMSSRGMLVRANPAPARGSYVEIGRGHQRIVARVVWADHDRFGARTQDALVLDAVAKGQPAADPDPAMLGNDRRSLRREDAAGEHHERSRRFGQRLEFVTIIAFGGFAAFLVFDTMHAVISKPLHQIESGLRGGR